MLLLSWLLLLLLAGNYSRLWHGVPQFIGAVSARTQTHRAGAGGPEPPAQAATRRHYSRRLLIGA
jgi:hypothetical protein